MGRERDSERNKGRAMSEISEMSEMLLVPMAKYAECHQRSKAAMAQGKYKISDTYTKDTRMARVSENIFKSYFKNFMCTQSGIIINNDCLAK